jgi:hypothetical protein
MLLFYYNVSDDIKTAYKKEALKVHPVHPVKVLIVSPDEVGDTFGPVRRRLRRPQRHRKPNSFRRLQTTILKGLFSYLV